MHRQRGMGMFGLFFLLVIFAFAAVVVMKSTPAYLEYFAIKRAMTALKQMEGAGAKELRDGFDKRAQVDDIKSVNAKDLVVEKDGSASVEYQVTVPLFANISLLFDFSASTAK
jgi:hypothetical protein